MAGLIEYVRALGQALKKPDIVIEGWLTDAKLMNGELSEEETKEIIRRRAICETCPFLSRNALESGNYHTVRKDLHCIQCGCPITKKTAALSDNCGIEVYNKRKQNKNKQLPLKWEAYKKPSSDDDPETDR